MTLSDRPSGEPLPDESRRLIEEKTAGNAGLLRPQLLRQLDEIRGWPETEETE